MWSVPDKETRELMIQFYRNILSGKMNRCQVLFPLELGGTFFHKGVEGLHQVL